MVKVTSVKSAGSTVGFADFDNESVFPTLDPFPEVKADSKSLEFYDDAGNYLRFSGVGFVVSFSVSNDNVTTIKIDGGTATKVSYHLDGKGGTVTGLDERLLDLVAAVWEGDPANLSEIVYSGNDVFDLKSGNDTVWGYGGDDTITVSSGHNVAWGGVGNDIIRAYAGMVPAGVTATLVSNEFHGEDGKDAISGSVGSDLLDGGRGADTLAGGAGTDVFVFASKYGRDTITDFSVSKKAHDVIELHITGMDALADLTQFMTARNGGVLIDFGADELFVADATIAKLNNTPGLFDFG